MNLDLLQTRLWWVGGVLLTAGTTISLLRMYGVVR